MAGKQRQPGTPMAFLDVMACGLGAVVLLFLIVKHNTEAVVAGAADSVTAEVETLAALRREADMLSAQIQAAEQRLREREASQGREAAAQAERVAEAAEASVELAKIRREIREVRTKNEALAAEIEALPPLQADDPVEDSRLGEEEYLLGLKVEGRRIAILVDRSASMTDEKLIDIIKRKIRSDSEKQKGPKWQRTVRTLRWLIQRVPAASEFAVITFNDKAAPLDEKGWRKGRDQTAVADVFREIDRLVPAGATNLEAGLRELAKLVPAATDIYLVTDGLPTKSISSPRRQGCSRSASATVSGECRMALFRAARRNSLPAGRKTNVILLPLEGDPAAAGAYWEWTSRVGGLLLTPASNWP